MKLIKYQQLKEKIETILKNRESLTIEETKALEDALEEIKKEQTESEKATHFDAVTNKARLAGHVMRVAYYIWKFFDNSGHGFP